MLESKPKSYKRHDWPEVFSQWQNSGLSRAEFCKLHDISSSAFYSALKRLNKDVKPEVAKKFVKAVMPERKLIHSCFVTLPNQVKIEIPGIDSEILKTLMMTSPRDVY